MSGCLSASVGTTNSKMHYSSVYGLTYLSKGRVDSDYKEPPEILIVSVSDFLETIR